VADVVAERDTLRELARCSPLPFVAMAYVILHLGAEASLLIVATFLTIVLLTRITHKKGREECILPPSL